MATTDNPSTTMIPWSTIGALFLAGAVWLGFVPTSALVVSGSDFVRGSIEHCGVPLFTIDDAVGRSTECRDQSRARMQQSLVTALLGGMVLGPQLARRHFDEQEQRRAEARRIYADEMRKRGVRSAALRSGTKGEVE